MKRSSDADDSSSNKRQTVGYDATFEKYTSCKASLGSVIKAKNWVAKFRSVTKILTDMRMYRSRAFCDYILSTIVTKRVILENKRQLKNMGKVIGVYS